MTEWGYPPSVYSEMPKLLERAGMSDKGSITGLYTVLVDGDDFEINRHARSISDGHNKGQELGQKNYPAIDVFYRAYKKGADCRQAA